MRAKEWIEMYQKATRGEASYVELQKLDKGTAWGDVQFDCYDILLIREGFARYERKEVDLRYFEKWCSVYARAIRIGHKMVVREEIAYMQIADILLDVSKKEKMPQDALREIEYHNDILEGKREPLGKEYTLAEDRETFYVELKDDNYIDVIFINHHVKTYAIYRNVEWWQADGGEDWLGGSYDETVVSRTIFELIYQNLHTLGYKKVQDGEE